MSTAADIDLARLEKVRQSGAKTIARCPACAESGDDKSGEHLVIHAGGKFGCVKYPGAEGAEHRKRIFALVGTVQAKQTRPRAPQRKARTRLVLESGTQHDLDDLAELRGIGIAGFTPGLDLAQGRGLLRFGDWQGRRCYFVTDGTGRNTQGRRLDGGKLTVKCSDPVKAKTVFGSKASWPIGTNEAAGFPCVALVEGGPDLLAAHQWLWSEMAEGSVAVVAMLGAGNSIPDDALAVFSGKRIRIFPHVDKAGKGAAVRWQDALQGAGATVDVFTLAGLLKSDGGTVSDLNDLAFLTDESARELRGVTLFDYAGETICQ